MTRAMSIGAVLIHSDFDNLSVAEVRKMQHNAADRASIFSEQVVVGKAGDQHRDKVPLAS
jgi:hypothetical protein